MARTDRVGSDTPGDLTYGDPLVYRDATKGGLGPRGYRTSYLGRNV